MLNDNYQNHFSYLAVNSAGTKIDLYMCRTLTGTFSAKMSVEKDFMEKYNENEFLFPAGAEVNIIPVMQDAGPIRINDADLPDSMPILALRNAVLFPGAIYPISIGREKSVKLIQDAERKGLFIGAVPQMDISVRSYRSSGKTISTRSPFALCHALNFMSARFGKWCPSTSMRPTVICRLS